MEKDRSKNTILELVPKVFETLRSSHNQNRHTKRPFLLIKAIWGPKVDIKSKVDKAIKIILIRSLSDQKTTKDNLTNRVCNVTKNIFIDMNKKDVWKMGWLKLYQLQLIARIIFLLNLIFQRTILSPTIILLVKNDTALIVWIAWKLVLVYSFWHISDNEMSYKNCKINRLKLSRNLIENTELLYSLLFWR